MRAETPAAVLRTAPTTFTPGGLDALPPGDVAHKAETVGVAKAGMAGLDVFVLAVLAGAFIALGAIFATTVAAGGSALSYGVVRLLAGVTFSLGLILVVAAVAELFTGNNLMA
jgi:formate transporter